jgi:hypothetical protein
MICAGMTSWCNVPILNLHSGAGAAEQLHCEDWVSKEAAVKQCVKQTSKVSSPPVVEGLIEGGTVQRPPEALWRSRIFFSIP